MRVFVCAQLPPDIRSDLGRVQDKLRRGGLKLKWVQPELLHFTLCFLGEIDPAGAAPLVENLEISMHGQESFQIALGHLGAFPRIDKAHVLWVGVRQGASALEALAHKAVNTVQACGLPFDRKPFKPHLTIARARQPARLRLPPDGPPVVSAVFPINSVTVMESQLNPQGPVYLPLGTILLKPGAE